METLLDQLLALLAGEMGLYRDMILVLQSEKDAIIDADLEALEENTREKSNLTIKVRILEEQRLRTVEKLSAALDHPLEGFNLLQIAGLVGGPYAARLEACHSNFASLMQSMGELNRTNSELLTHSLKTVRESLGFLENLGNMHSVYQENGHFGSGSRSGRFLSGRA